MIELPFVPRRASLVQIRPRRLFEGVYSPGFIQSRTQLSYWRGTIEFSPFTTAAEVREWREWSVAAESQTVRIPAYAPGWQDPENWQPIGLVANDESGRRFAYAGEGPPAGALLELKTSGSAVSVVSQVEAPGVLESYSPVLGHVLGQASDAREDIMGQWSSPKFGGVIMNSDVESLVQSSSKESRAAVVEWRESRAEIMAEYGDYPYVEGTPPVFITTEAGDPITTEAEIGIST